MTYKVLEYKIFNTNNNITLDLFKSRNFNAIWDAVDYCETFNKENKGKMIACISHS